MSVEKGGIFEETVRNAIEGKNISQISSKEEDTIIINPVNYTLIITSKFNPEELFEIKNSYEVEKFHRLFEVVHTDENYLDFKNE
ncbi:hypothetical protein ENUP19_0011G0009 [Entamoeba nuttalli]|uniref:Uncharacterized protein n=1 Tax=Entamoeba nuttalli TaxID=412467 RepID=A0ABQ0D827_9EUKA